MNQDLIVAVDYSVAEISVSVTLSPDTLSDFIRHPEMPVKYLDDLADSNFTGCKIIICRMPQYELTFYFNTSEWQGYSNALSEIDAFISRYSPLPSPSQQD